MHYRTEDRGRTWRPFNVIARPALVSQPLSFHSDPKKYGYILYQGTTCEGVGWSAKCRDQVLDISYFRNVVDLGYFRRTIRKKPSATISKFF